MTELASLNRDAAKERPESVFERPLEIVNEVLFIDELGASGEGMATRGHTYGQLAVLEEIEEAKARLKKRRQPKKQNEEQVIALSRQAVSLFRPAMVASEANVVDGNALERMRDRCWVR